MKQRCLSQRPRLALACVATLVFAAGPGRSQECAYLGATENFNSIAYCVSSVLKGRYHYGPDNLFDWKSETAWCEGVSGNGEGQIVSLRIDGGGPFRRFLIENGYGKSDELFLRNARPRTIEIRTDTGLQFRHVLEDTPTERMVDLPQPGAYKTLQLRVIDVYPGTKYEDMCISTILVDFDYEKYLEFERRSVTPDDEGGQAVPDALPDTAPAERPPKFEELPALPKL